VRPFMSGRPVAPHRSRPVRHPASELRAARPRGDGRAQIGLVALESRNQVLQAARCAHRIEPRDGIRLRAIHTFPCRALVRCADDEHLACEAFCFRAIHSLHCETRFGRHHLGPPVQHKNGTIGPAKAAKISSEQVNAINSVLVFAHGRGHASDRFRFRHGGPRRCWPRRAYR